MSSLKGLSKNDSNPSDYVNEKKYLNCFTKRNILLDKLNQFIIINDEIFL